MSRGKAESEESIIEISRSEQNQHDNSRAWKEGVKALLLKGKPSPNPEIAVITDRHRFL